MTADNRQAPLGILPREWKVVRINQICKVRRGASPRPISDPTYFSDSGRGWIRISDVTGAHKYLRETSQYLSKKGISKSVKVNPRDLIMSICATIGRPIILDMEACIHDGFVWFSGLSANVDTEFLYYVLQMNEFKFVGMKQTGTQGNLNTTIVGRMQIPLPPLPEQKRIAEVLSTVDNAIQKVDLAIAETERLKKGLMQKLLTEGIGHKEFKKTKIGKIPKDWRVVELRSIVDEEGGIVAGPFGSNLKVCDYKPYGVPIIRLQNIERNRFINKDIKFISPEKAEELSYHSYQSGDIVLAKLGDPIGKTCIVPSSMKAGVVVADVVRIRPSPKKAITLFLEYLLNSSMCFYQLRRQTIGSTRPRVNISQVRNLKIPLLTLDEQQQIADILSTVDYKLELDTKRKEKLERIKKGLMNDLLTGKKRIRVD